jgi:flagellar hook-basal body complex protein FliE
MRITPVNFTGSIDRVTKTASTGAGVEVKESAGDVAGSFKNAIEKAVGEVNHLQNSADKSAVKLASGDIEDVHEAMIAMQKAKLSLDFTIQVRNKVIEAYQEVMRMQV